MVFEPVMRTDEHHVEKHERILKMKERKIGVVFLGDSLTRRWEDYEEVWNKYFAKYHPANFGVGSDSIQNVKWRILHRELDGIAPRVLILLIGTNNLPTNSVAEIVSGIEELVEIIREKLPNTKLLLLGLLPRNLDDQGIDYNAKITAINQKLQAYCAEHQVRFAEIGGVLPQRDGQVEASVMPDGLHLNEEGYELIGPELVRYIEELW
ncbi:MAG TPA: hypothetical protein GXZ36_00160 [Firmicutes bacterium]|jgi:platelet-activating factor acetylhydrolase IB subunit beta/gamma|nr:hypothetical protein [Bacillota bacterium]